MRLTRCLWVAALVVSVEGRGAARPPLSEAARAGDLTRVKQLVASGADVNARDTQGRTPLLEAAQAGSLRVVTALVTAGADANGADHNGLTPLIEAVRLGHEEVARALLDAGADADVRHRAFGTALDVAERGERAALAQLLRARGAHGSGHSTGDLVCVRPWDGEGFCGRVLAISGARYQLQVERLVGCEDGCAARACSGQRPLGGRAAGAVRAGDELWLEGSCLTDTGVADE